VTSRKYGWQYEAQCFIPGSILYSELYVCLRHVILYKFHRVTSMRKTTLRSTSWAGRILIRLLVVRLKIYFFHGMVKVT